VTITRSEWSLSNKEARKWGFDGPIRELGKEIKSGREPPEKQKAHA